MRLTAWLPLAALSALALCGAATRPHYGGTLRVELRAAPTAFDPAAAPLASLAFETLVRLDAAGTPQPSLALSWQHDASAKRWQFHLRPGVKFHDGTPLTPAAVASSLQAAFPDLTVAAGADFVSIRAPRSSPDLVLLVAHNGQIFTHATDNSVAGTGPFRLTAFDPGHHATFAANPDYWAGRPFLDSIEVQLGRSLRDQLADLELGKADLIEVAPLDLRHASEHGRSIWPSAPADLIALSFAPGRVPDPRLREALARSIDRSAMRAVLLQKQGDLTAALLPQWLSGYAFAFSTAPDLARARELANALPAAARTIALSYDPALSIARSLAERIAVNARDAGLVVHVAPQNPAADLRLVEIPVTSLDPSHALASLAAALGFDAPAPASSSAALYESEHRLLESFAVIPLFHLPVEYAVTVRLRAAAPSPITRLGDWCFDNVWLSPTAP